MRRFQFHWGRFPDPPDHVCPVIGNQKASIPPQCQPCRPANNLRGFGPGPTGNGINPEPGHEVFVSTRWTPILERYPHNLIAGRVAPHSKNRAGRQMHRRANLPETVRCWRKQGQAAQNATETAHQGQYSSQQDPGDDRQNPAVDFSRYRRRGHPKNSPASILVR